MAGGRTDECLCACGYPNGVIAGLLGQILLLAAFACSFIALGDCNFVTIQTALADAVDIPDFVDDIGLRELGFYTFEQSDGDCYWYTTGDKIDRVLEWYVRTFTDDWEISRAFASAAFVLGFVILVYSTTYCCLSHIRCCRRFLVVLCIVAATLQGLSFLAFSTDFCDDYDCKMGRAARYCIVATVFYFVSGICFLLLSPHPGLPFKAPKTKADRALPKKAEEPLPESAPPKATAEDETDVENPAPVQESSDDVVEEEEPIVEEEVVEEEEEVVEIYEDEEETEIVEDDRENPFKKEETADVPKPMEEPPANDSWVPEKPTA